MWARYNQAQDNYQTVNTCYHLLLKHCQSPYVYPSFLEYLFNTKQYAVIVQLTPVVQRMVSLDVPTRLIFAQSLYEVGLLDNALQQLEELVKEHPSHPEIMYAAAQTHLLNNNPHKALHVIETYLTKTASHEHALAFHFMKAQIFTLQQKYPAARSSLQTTLDLHPTFDKGWLLLGLVNELEGNTPQAINGYKRYLQLTGSNEIIEEQIARLQSGKKTQPPSLIK
jgi:predicted Zn-dependent protease